MFFFAEKQERPEQLRLGVHQGGPSPDPRQPGSGANDQPTGVWRGQLLQPGLRKTGHNIICPLPFQGFVQTLGGERNIKTYFLSKLKMLLFLWKTLRLAGYLVNLPQWFPLKIEFFIKMGAICLALPSKKRWLTTWVTITGIIGLSSMILFSRSSNFMEFPLNFLYELVHMVWSEYLLSDFGISELCKGKERKTFEGGKIC